MVSTSNAADLPRVIPSSGAGAPIAAKKKTGRARTAQAALFENNDLARAARLAAQETKSNRRNPEPLFVAMQTAAMTADSGAELRAAVALCRLKTRGVDPRVKIAAAHMLALAANTETFRLQAAEVQRIAGSDSPCAQSAREAMYAAALDGLPGSDARESARVAGFLTLWTMTPEKNRSGNPLPANTYFPERLEFSDARLQAPEYLPASFRYAAESEYAAPTEGNYKVQIAGANGITLMVDGRVEALESAIHMKAGVHSIRVELPGSHPAVRVRVVRAAEMASHKKSFAFTEREAELIEAEMVLIGGNQELAVDRLQQPALQESALAQWMLSRIFGEKKALNDERFALRRVRELAPRSLAAEMRLAEIEVKSGNNDVALPMLQRAVEMRPQAASAHLLLARAAAATGLNLAASAAFHAAAELHPSCATVREGLEWFYAQGDREAVGALEAKLGSCAPASLALAEWLGDTNRHALSGQELQSRLKQWPLDRNAYRELIAELQRSGDHGEANRVAAEFVAIAPNTRTFRRLAGAAAVEKSNATAFYEPYRRAIPVALSSAPRGARGVLLLQDKVAVARQDGSVSVYVHRVLRWESDRAPESSPLPLPANAQVVRFNVVSAGLAPQAYSRDLEKSLKPGDVIDQEYVLNYVGEGGMIGHPEAFQYVFHDFDYPLLEARFVVLTPIAMSPGYIIASGQAPPVRFEHHDGLRAEIWDKPAALAENGAPAVIRVVENENGWSIPPSVERRRIIETIHKGPRPKEA